MPVLQAQRGGAEETAGSDDEGGTAADPQRLGDPLGEVAGTGGGGTVEGDACPGTAVGGFQVEQALGEPVAEPVPSDRFQSHPPMMRQAHAGPPGHPPADSRRPAMATATVRRLT